MLCNFMLARILLGLVIAGVGFLMAWRTQWFMDLIGPIDWAERNLGGGGTRTFYKLFGMTVILIGFLMVTNLFEMVIGGAVTSLLG